MATPFQFSDWQEEVVAQLIKAGTNGMLQRDLTKYVVEKVTAAEVVTYLEYLMDQRKVDRFIRYTTEASPQKGPAATFWRATNKIREI